MRGAANSKEAEFFSLPGGEGNASWLLNAVISYPCGRFVSERLHYASKENVSSGDTAVQFRRTDNGFKWGRVHLCGVIHMVNDTQSRRKVLTCARR